MVGAIDVLAINQFSGWSGDCTGTSTTCDLTMDANKSVTATFVLTVIRSADRFTYLSLRLAYI